MICSQSSSSSFIRFATRIVFALVILCTTTQAVAQGGGRPLTEAERAQAEADDNEGRLRGAELARELPGLEMSEGPPSFLIFPALQVHFPYQVIGLGVAFEVLPVKWLRMSALYSFGVSPQEGKIAWTSYAEALLGVRLFGADTETAVDVPLRPRGAGLFPNVPVVKAWVPAHHALFLEAGGTTGFFSFDTCSENCDAVAEGQPRAEATQLVMPMGGVRYVYGFDLRSKRRNARKRFLLEAYAHVLGPPLNAPDGPRYFHNGSSAGKAGLGGRLGVITSPGGACIAEVVLGFGCLDGGLTLGYAPYPRTFVFEMQVGGFVY